MKTAQQRSDAAYSAVLAHASYACLESESIETKIRELVIGLKGLCDEYGVDFDEAVVAPVESEAVGRKVSIPTTPTVEVLTAMSVALGMEPLTNGSDGSYPITGAQSTVRQCYAAIVRTTESNMPASSISA